MSKYIIYMMVGLPASGKTTLATAMADEIKARYVSRDELRELITGSREVVMENEQYIRNNFCDTIVSSFVLPKPIETVFADATHMTIRSRLAFLHGIAHAAEKFNTDMKDISIIPIIMETSFPTCMERNSQRPDYLRVPIKDMYNYCLIYSPPSKIEVGFETCFPVRYFYNTEKEEFTKVIFEDKSL